jgi:uncharacterized Fe-S cluster-containing radical SAM superfamily protein
MSNATYGVDRYTKTFGRDRIVDMLTARHGQRYLDYRAAWRKAGPDWLPDYPLNVIFDLVDRCNQACPQCLRAPDLIKDYSGFLGTRKAIPHETVQRIMEESARHGLPSVNIGGGGEGTLHPDFLKICRTILDAGVCELRVITNGLRLQGDIVEGLIDLQVHIVSISIDAFSPESYKISRGSAKQYQTVVDNVRGLVEAKRRRGSEWPLVRLSFCEQMGNRHETNAFVEFWSQYADMVEIQSFMDFRKSSDFDNDFECLQPFQRLMVWAYGGAGPCCGFPGIVYNVGDYAQRSVYDIWHGPEMEAMRTMMRTREYERPCLQCLGTRTVF